MSEEPLLLDTHVLVWVMGGQHRRIPERVVERIERASRSGGVRVSAISTWEIAMLEAKGRLGLSRPVEEWLSEALRAPGCRMIDLTPAIAVASTRLPGEFVGDPADRIIVASARAAGAVLVTADRAIVEYARAGHVRVLDAGG